MSGYRRIDPSIKSTILKQAKEDHRPIAEISAEFGVHTKTIYAWLGSEVDGTGKTASSYLAEIHKLQREKEDLISIIGSFSIVVERMKKKMKKTDCMREVYEENKTSQHPVKKSTFTQIGKLAGISMARSSLSYLSKMDQKDQEEKQKLEDLHKEHPWYGHRRIAWSCLWSMKKSRRLMKKFHITPLQKK